ncbi:hypothetical protein [Anaerosphaera multitolerans]|uniref:Uncharacterized protein n=1 Tax=Anaerosphaera multitolerans TaxID=2487351 RepID=A0A437S6X8_9FIRM|nr:hypothetical protein [Anaerosphaera multitolerans]RVU54667.1 hypothetical protein EF514_06075 [Anaerosphaera multitolerans]
MKSENMLNKKENFILTIFSLIALIIILCGIIPLTKLLNSKTFIMLGITTFALGNIIAYSLAYLRTKKHLFTLISWSIILLVQVFLIFTNLI